MTQNPSVRSVVSDDGRGPSFPTRQMLVLAICRICEPIAFMGIFPYAYFMVKDFHVTDNEDRISFYAGMVTSAFTFAEFCTGLFWGRLSDKIGRKPVLLIGLSGTAFSVIMFGLAPNLTTALVARALGGLLNGNMGVLQTTVAELVTVKEHQPRAYTIMPVVWCMGSIVGPMIGGALARPVDSYPGIFAPNSVWDRYPYFLPNLFSAFVVVIGFVNGILFLEETHAEKKYRRDRGRELGNWILSRIPSLPKWKEIRSEKVKMSQIDENEPLIGHNEEQLPGYQTNENSPNGSPTLRSTPTAQDLRDSLDIERETTNGGSGIFTRQVILNIMSFGILAFHTMTFDSMFPIFMSTDHPEPPKPVSLPFQFSDGFGFGQQTVGLVLSVQGVYSLVMNMFIVPPVLKRFGPLRLFRFLVVAYFSLYLITPYLVLLPERFRMAGIGFVLVWKCTFASMAYPANAILTADSAPSHLALGTINGVAASTASLSRAFGPTVSGLLYTVGLTSGYSGLAWWCSAVVAIAGGVVGLQVREPNGRFVNNKPVPQNDAEAGQPHMTQVTAREAVSGA